MALGCCSDGWAGLFGETVHEKTIAVGNDGTI